MVDSVDVLREVALDQHGLVTFRQAMNAGVSQPALSMLVKRKRVERVAHGVYRVPQVPVTQFDPFMLAVLWTGVPEACLSHDTALAGWEVSDINPTAIHVTVSARRRIQRAGGEGYVLHHEDLEPDQMTWWQGVPSVTIPTAIVQCLDTGVPTYLVRQAIERASRTGDLTAGQTDELTRRLEARYA
ncbi:MAG: type IV toxin-antitoxin system AbiEi family antitoxin domain-containing protein [Micrococcales bacterium]|nr:type IV toxin-antitoxin system AbiEi family antitoxin domain-containing protein [Micrococcales bacterium]